MAAPEAKTFDERLQRWLLSDAVARLSGETGIPRSTLHRWLAKDSEPTGFLRRAFEVLVLVPWEQERAKPVEVPRVARKAPPVPVRR